MPIHLHLQINAFVYHKELTRFHDFWESIFCSTYWIFLFFGEPKTEPFKRKNFNIEKRSRGKYSQFYFIFCQISDKLKDLQFKTFKSILRKNFNPYWNSWSCKMSYVFERKYKTKTLNIRLDSSLSSEKQTLIIQRGVGAPKYALSTSQFGDERSRGLLHCWARVRLKVHFQGR